MQIPLEWLKEYVKVDATAEEVATRLTMGGLEVEGIETHPGVGTVLDVYVTPNRGDCLSLIGVAREVAALYGLPLHMPSPPPSRGNGETAQQTSVTLEDRALCPRYAARLVRGVKIGPSPVWMQQRLEAAKLRPINNVVDVTNYVMLEMGQPLHAFDFNRLAEQRIVVRQAHAGEKIKTLDGVERELHPPMLVIADAIKAVAIAGIMGGEESEVSDTTTDILIESAHFAPLSIRKTSKALDLKSDAHYRFERVVDPDGVRRAVDRACQLLEEMGQPNAVEGVVDVYPHPIEAREVKLRVHRAVALLGMELTSHICADSLRALHFEVSTEGHGETDTLRVHVPTFRPDITLEEDLIEEVARIYGYENIPETLPQGDTTQGGDSDLGRFITTIKRTLVEAGLQEVVTHSLTAEPAFDTPADAMRRVPVRNAQSSELSGLRRSLLPTLMDVAKLNISHGQQNMGLFEVGRVWQNEEQDGNSAPTEYIAVGGLLLGSMVESGWQRNGKSATADLSALRGVLDKLFQGLRITDVTLRPLGDRAEALPQFHPGRSATLSLQGGRPDGVMGEIHPQMAEGVRVRDRIYVFEISLEALRRAAPMESPRYRSISSYPAVSRDIAPHIAESVLYAEVDAAVRAAGIPFLESFRLTDLFRGEPLAEGVKSLTLSFSFRALDRTLTEAEINEALVSIRTSLQNRCAATFAG